MCRLTMPAAVMTLLLSIVPVCRAQAPAAQQPVDPDIQRLMELTGASRAGTMMASLIAAQIQRQMQQQHPDVPPRALEIIRTTLDEEFKAAFAPDGPLMHELAGVWSKHFTHDEVLGLIAFYDTPLGRKITGSMPVIMQECAQAGTAWGQQSVPAISKKVQERLRAEGFIK